MNEELTVTAKADEKIYLTPGEVADLLMVSPAAVRRWASDGELKALTTPGGHRRFLPEDVDNFARKRNIVIEKKDKQGLRVLIVDDDKQFSGYLLKMLNKYPGKMVAELANDGFEAGIKVNDFKPDVVLLDLMMPGMDGFKVCEKLKKNNAIKKLRVIAMTGYMSDSNVEKIMAAGAEVCLPKPVDRQVLLDCLGMNNVKSAKFV